MRITRFTKAVIYEFLTALLLLLSFLFQRDLRDAAQIETAYGRSNWFLFIAAAVMLGVGVYSIMSYTRRYREHILDSVFFILLGVLYMVAFMTVFLMYGGLEGTFDESGYVAANINIILIGALPLPFLIRTIVLVFSTREPRVGRRVGVQIVCGLLTAVLAVLIFTGNYLRMAEYVDPATTDTASDDGTEMDMYDPYGDAYDVG